MSKHIVVVRKIVIPDDFFEEALADKAAQEAAEYLLGNWNAVLHEGGDLTSCLHDVDDVCKILQAWRDAIIRELP